MADTARNKSDLLALLPDNTSGAISPQDLRDVVESAQIHGASCWDDTRGDLFNADKRAGLTLEDYRDTDHQVYFANHDAVNTVSLRLPMPHRFNGSAGVRVHAHTFPAATGAGNVVFQTTYAWERVGYEMPAVSGWTTTTSTMAVVSANVYKSKVHHLASVAVATGVGAAAILWVTVKRIGTAATDTYSTNKVGGDASANLGISYIDAHYQVKQAGTEAEF